MGTIGGLLFLVLVAAGGFALGLVRGRGRSPKGSAQQTDDGGAYRAGYLAGHMAGWRDALAKTQAAPLGSASPTRGGAGTWTPPPGWPGQTTGPHPPTHPVPSMGWRQPAPPMQPQQPAPPMRPQQPAQPGFAAQTMAPPSSVLAGQPLPPAPQHARVRPESAEEVAARKDKRDRQNINITLYVASLLLVAAGALFVGTSLPEMFRFVALWGITVLFYVAGLVLHPRVPPLRPAALAFTGTGLALVPITGLAMYNFALHNGPLAWLATSLLGTGAYVFAAVRLNNKVLAWLSLSFVVSTAWSGVSVLGGALVWYFISLIAVAVVLTLLALAHPRWVSPLYVQPLMALHPFVVPAVGLAATVTPNVLAKGEYPLVMAICGTYFAVMMLVPAARYRNGHFFAARAAFTLAIIASVWDGTSDVSLAMLAAVACLGVQAIGMSYAGKAVTPRTWWNDAVSCLGFQLLVALVLTMVLGVGAFDLPKYVPFLVVLPTAMVLGWRLRQGVAFAPAAVLCCSLVLADLVGAWPLALMLGATGAYWFALAALARGFLGRCLVLAGRLAFTFAVPAVVAGVLVGHQERVPLTVLAFVVVAGVQQVLSAVFERRGFGVVAARASTGLFGCAAALGLLVLAVLEHLPGHPVLVSGVLALLVAGLASGWMAFPRVLVPPTTGQSRTPWRLTIGELLAPGAGMVALLVSATAVSRGAANLVLLAITAYLLATALRLPVSVHRRVYWWLARAAGTVLVASAYADLQGHGWALGLAGEDVTVASVVVWVLAGQLLVVLVAGRRGTSLQTVTADVGVLLAAMAVATISFNVATRVPALTAYGGWQPGAAAIVTTLAAAICSIALRSHRIAWIFAPASVALLLLRAGSVRDVEIMLGILLAYGCIMAVLAQAKPVRGAYLVAVRVASAALVTLVAADVADSTAVPWLALGLVTFLQLITHCLAHRRLDDVPFQRVALWSTLGLQAGLPLVYLLAGDFDGGGRWVLLLGFALAGLASLLVRRTLRAAVALYPGLAAVTLMVVFAGPFLDFPSTTFLHHAVLDRFQVPVLLLACAMVVTLAKTLLRGRPTRGAGGADRWLWFVSAVVFAGTACLATVDTSPGMVGGAVLAVAIVFFAASHLESIPSFYAGAAPTALVGAVTAVGGLLDAGAAGPWADFLPWLVGGVGMGSLLYGLRWFGGLNVAGQPGRRASLAATTLVAYLAGAAVGLAHDSTALAGAFLLAIAGGIAAAEVPHQKHLVAEVAAIVALVGFQRALLFVDGARPDWFWAAQWYVVTAVVLAGVRYLRGHRGDAILRLGVASGFLSLSSVATIFGGTPPQQVYVLAAHAALLGVGLLLSERLFTAWGAAGVAASVMWALRSYAFALLALVAVALIVLAVWRLNRGPRPSDRAASDGSGRGGEGVG
ncbi:hypothetical protein ACIPY3_01265 [Paenarthrobacter sp. NPDC089714]|uniref:hypothetical protein n=1 Tax=Paenarthrobacter sp. NPDC089714 TaxID=3364377 RepID=UPI0037F42A59